MRDAAQQIHRLEGEIMDKKKDKDTHQRMANEKKNAPMAHVQDVTKKQVDQINKLLEKNSPYQVVDFLESFVGLLRNHPQATNIDVEVR